MNEALKKLRSRNLQANFKQFLSVILIVFLSVMLFSGFVTNSHTLSKSVDKYFEKTNLADVWVYTDRVTAEDESFFSKNQIDYCNRLFIETTGRVEELNTENISKIYVSDGKISTPYIERGLKGCLIDKNIAKSLGVSVGYDNFKFTFDYLGTSVTLSFRITGTMSLDECADTYSAWPVFLDEKVFLNKLNEQLSEENKLDKLFYNQVLIKTDNVEETKSKIENHYQTSNSSLLFMLDRTSIQSVVLLESEVGQSKKMLYVFPIIFLIVAVLVILTTINQLVLQEKSRIGTLKSIGVPDKKILKHYSSYGAYLCAIGAALGTIAGPLVIPNIMFVKYDLVYSIPKEYVSLSVPWLWVLLIFVLIVVLGYLVSYLACLEILHKKPIECLRQEINLKIKSKNKKSKIKLPISLKMATRNIKIKPVRTIMAIIGITGCVALLLSGFGVGDTLKNSVKNDLGKLFTYDITTTYENSNFEEELKKVDGVKVYEKYHEFYAEVKVAEKIKTTSVFQISENSKFVSETILLDDVCLSESLADEFKIHVGDKLNVSVANKTVEVAVTKIIETSFYNGVYVCKNFGFNENFATKGMWIDCENEPFEVAEKVNAINGTNTAKTMQQMIESTNEKISAISVMTTTIKVFAVMLAVIVLLNVVLLILKERTKEIATMKVIGLSMKTIVFSLFFEILFMTIFGIAIGSCLGYPLLVLILKINKVEIMNFLYNINVLSYIFTTLIVFATIFVVILITVLKIKKVNMVESLKSVE